MTKPAPVVYLLHGEDEFSIAQFIHDIEDKLGDPASAAMNINRFDGRSAGVDDLASVAFIMPFLTSRRLVIFTNPTTRLTAPAARKKFTDFLEKIPATTALVLVEYKLLTEERDRRRNKINWLEKWADEAGEGVLKRAFTITQAQMSRWIQDRAKIAGGRFSPQGAQALADLVGEDARVADQEIHKLLTYVNYVRPVEPEDVQMLTSNFRQADIFAMVDALGSQDGQKAFAMLQRLLEEDEPLSIFGMVIRQFRLLLLARDVLDRGGRPEDVARDLKIGSFVVDKLIPQARRFNLPELEQVYHTLLEMDEAIKSSQMDGGLALDTFAAALTAGSH
jgi:DNA polymerase III subunit delta